jgi:hypothetical protein
MIYILLLIYTMLDLSSLSTEELVSIEDTTLYPRIHSILVSRLVDSNNVNELQLIWSNIGKYNNYL